MTPEDRALFERWITVPLAALRAIPNGDGGFAALSMAFGLYERFLTSRLHRAGGDSDDKARYREASADFGGQVSAEDFKNFWDMYRVGMQHFFHPKSFTKGKDGTKWGWEISEHGDYKAYPVIQRRGDNIFVITLNPWAFADHVIQRWNENGDLLNELSVAELGEISIAPVPNAPSTPPPEARAFITHSLTPPPVTYNSTGQF
jgi:hypothetical protein